MTSTILSFRPTHILVFVDGRGSGTLGSASERGLFGPPIYSDMIGEDA